MTFDTVGTDTPVWAAMNAIVVPLRDRRSLGAIAELMTASLAFPAGSGSFERSSRQRDLVSSMSMAPPKTGPSGLDSDAGHG